MNVNLEMPARIWATKEPNTRGDSYSCWWISEAVKANIDWKRALGADLREYVRADVAAKKRINSMLWLGAGVVIGQVIVMWLG